MPKLNDHDLPVVTVTADTNLSKLVENLKAEKMPVEAWIELAIYLKREIAKVDALSKLFDEVRGVVTDELGGVLPEKREDRSRVDVGQATYTEGRTTERLKDRDATVEALTDEQIRISYKPDIGNLRTILKPEKFAELVETTRSKPSVSIRENKGNRDFHEIDFGDEF